MSVVTSFDVEALAAVFHAVGSKEVKRHLAVSMDAAARENRDGFRDVLRQTIGRNVKGPAGLRGDMSGHFGQASEYTINAVRYVPQDFDGIDEATPDDRITARVFIADKQGSKNNDQSAILKYGFGDGSETRTPGDVGMADDRILIPQNEAIFGTQHLAVNPFWNGGRQLPGLLKKLDARAKAGKDDLDSAIFGIDGPASRASRKNRDRAAALGINPDLHDRDDMLAMDPTSRAHRLAMLARFDDEGVREGARRMNRRLPLGPTDIVPSEEGPQAVFRGPDRKSGLPTWFSRPIRVRDPAGGTHTVVGRNGKVSRYPNTINIRPDTGQRGRAVGPASLLLARSSVNYGNRLRGPWDANNAATFERLPVHVEAELAHVLERKLAGRSY